MAVFVDEYGREILFDDYGQPLGQVIDSDDGAKILMSLDGGEILAASSADGEPLNPAEYVLDDDTSDLSGRLDAMEAAQHEDSNVIREAMALQHAQQAAEAEAAEEQSFQDVDSQSAALRRILGRPLLDAESQALGNIIAADVQAGRQIDLVNAFDRGRHEGIITRGRLETVSDRRNHITDALNESDAADRQQHVAENGPEYVDVATREGRAAFIDAAVQGDTESREFYSSEGES